MTDIQKHQINEMRRYGCTYRHIAEALSLNAETVSSYCSRAIKKGTLVIPESNSNSLCKQCGIPIKQTPKRKKRIFCSDPCRKKWWNSHTYLVNRSSKAIYHFTCKTCGKGFSVYGDSSRKYCSHECYINNRFYKESVDDKAFS